jgi:maltodextrin utilization protein YvdJ
MIAHYAQQLRDDMRSFMELDMESVTGRTYEELQLQRISSTESQPMSLSDADRKQVAAFTKLTEHIRRTLAQLTWIRPGS